MEKDTELMLDVGQANEFKLACRRAGFTNGDIKKMCEGNTLATLLPVVKGLAEVIVNKHPIDCDTEPFLPSGWKIEEHVKGGWEWDLTKVRLYLSIHQEDGSFLEGNKLRKELPGSRS